MKKFFNEFKDFAMKGNMIDMAVGIVVGSAFTAIVNSLVADIITPIISLLTGGINFSDLSITLAAPEINGVKIDPLTLNYGNFLQTLFQFIVIAFSMFLIVRAMNRIKANSEKLLKKQEEEKAPEAPKQSDEVIALNKIIQLLENNQKK